MRILQSITLIVDNEKTPQITNWISGSIKTINRPAALLSNFLHLFEKILEANRDDLFNFYYWPQEIQLLHFKGPSEVSYPLL